MVAHLEHHFSFVLRNITVQHVSVSRHGVGRCQEVGFSLGLTEDNRSAVRAAVHLQRVDNNGRTCAWRTRNSQVLQHVTPRHAAQTDSDPHLRRPSHRSHHDQFQAIARSYTTVLYRKKIIEGLCYVIKAKALNQQTSKQLQNC